MEQSAAEKLEMNKAMFRNIGFSCRVLSAEFIPKQKNWTESLDSKAVQSQPGEAPKRCSSVPGTWKRGYEHNSIVTSSLRLGDL